jgi:hypothetical protein
MFGYGVVKTQVAEPSISEVQMYLLAQPALGTDTKQ